MSRLVVLLFVLIIPFTSKAKEPYYTRFNTDSFWRKLVVEPSGLPLSLSPRDTVIIVASNRARGKDSLRFMSELRGDGGVTYFLAYIRGSQWRLRLMPSLQDAVQALPDPDKDWVVYTEGMGKIFTTGLDRGFRVCQAYGVNVLLLDYPSIHTKYKSYRNFRFVLRNSSVAYRDFLPVLDTLQALRESAKAGTGALSLFFHSMGNNVIRKIGQTNSRDRLNESVWVDNIILNAPCVPQRRSHRWIDSLGFAKRIYVHYNPEDRTLKWSRIAGARGILGERPQRPIAARAAYVNFNTLCGDGHSNFLNFSKRMMARPEAVRHYQKLLHGDSVQLHDPAAYRRSVYRGIGWDLLPDRNERMKE